jgi:hypothetical protein
MDMNGTLKFIQNLEDWYWMRERTLANINGAMPAP